MSVTIRDGLSRGATVEWFEAVAIVQALCKRLLDHPPESGIRVPDLHEIAIDTDGGITTTGDGPVHQSPVFRVGEVLMALVAGGPMPVPLRLLALTAVSPSPPYGTIQELTTALDFYERPDRAAVLRAVGQRWQQLPAVPAASPVEAIPAEPPTAAAPPARWRRRRAAVAAAYALVLLAGVAAAAWWAERSDPPWLASGSRQVAQVVGAAADTVSKTLSSGIEALRARVAGTSAADATASASPPAHAPAGTIALPAHAVLPTTGGWLRPGARTTFEPPAAPAASSDRIAEAATMMEASLLPASLLEVEDWTIYSAEDLDVVPPVSIHPRLPSEPPPGIDVESLPLVELVIAASGEVESARLEAPSPDVRTSMMISAVKAWRFQPATRQGRAVRYRQTIRLTNM